MRHKAVRGFLLFKILRNRTSLNVVLGCTKSDSATALTSENWSSIDFPDDSFTVLIYSSCTKSDNERAVFIVPTQLDGPPRTPENIFKN